MGDNHMQIPNENVQPQFNQSPKYLPVASEKRNLISCLWQILLLRKVIECKILLSNFKMITKLVSNEIISSHSQYSSTGLSPKKSESDFFLF